MATMNLDETRRSYHVRGCNNRIRVTVMITLSGAYVYYERRVEIDTETYEWETIAGTSKRVTYHRDEQSYRNEQDLLAQEFYDAAPARFGRRGDRES